MIRFLRTLGARLDLAGIDFELVVVNYISIENTAIELSLSALIRNYNILQVPISWQGRTWGSSNLHLMEMGRRYLSTLIKIFFEKTLIRDDLIAETLSHRSRCSNSVANLESRVERLEARLEALERDGK